MWLRYLSFYPDFSGHIGKRRDKKAKVNFKIYDVTDWGTNDDNANIAQYLKKENQSYNEVWSANKI